MIPQNPMRIPIYSVMHQSENLAIEAHLWWTIEDLRKAVAQKIGYATRIYLYQMPVTAFNKIDFLNMNTTLQSVCKAVKKEHEIIQLAILYNNTQYREQPGYFSQNNQPTQISEGQNFEIVFQILQNNYFVHESYRIQVSNKVSFLTGIANKYGGAIYLEYETSRIKLQPFGDTTISVLQHWVDSAKRITVSVAGRLPRDDEVDGEVRQISEINHINFQTHYIMKWEQDNKQTRNYVISRRSDITSILKLMDILYQTRLLISLDNNSFEQVDESRPLKFEDIVYVRSDSKYRSPIAIQPIKNCQILSSFPTSNHALPIYIIEQSAIFHCYSLNINNQTIQSSRIHHLPCVPTTSLDEDLFFILPSNNHHFSATLIAFSITIHGVSLRHFDTSGNLLVLNKEKWNNGEIEFKTNDLFCVKTKKDQNNGVFNTFSFKIFYMHDPANAMEISNIVCSEFFPARYGFNPCSDATGLFAIHSKWSNSIIVYRFVSRSKNNIPICEIKCKKQVQYIFFSNQSPDITQRIIAINHNNQVIALYDMKGNHISDVLCLPNMSNFFFIGSTLVSCSQTQLYEFEEMLRWSKPKFIPLNYAIIMLPNREVIVPTQILQFKRLQGFYFYDSEIKN